MFGLLLQLATFPGVIVHELAHLFFCRRAGVPVYEVCLFRLGNPAGYVVHAAPRSAWRHFLICIGPLLVNSCVGFAFGLAAALSAPAGTTTWPSGVLLWLGASVAIHAFPSFGDAQALWQGFWQPGSSVFAKLLAIPLVALLYLGALGAMFWLNLVYGGLVAVWLPRWVLAMR